MLWINLGMLVIMAAIWSYAKKKNSIIKILAVILCLIVFVAANGLKAQNKAKIREDFRTKTEYRVQ